MLETRHHVRIVQRLEPKFGAAARDRLGDARDIVADEAEPGDSGVDLHCAPQRGLSGGGHRVWRGPGRVGSGRVGSGEAGEGKCGGGVPFSQTKRRGLEKEANPQDTHQPRPR